MPKSGTVMPFLSEAAESLEAAGSAGRSEPGRSRSMRHRPFLLLDFRPCIRTGNRCFSMGRGLPSHGPQTPRKPAGRDTSSTSPTKSQHGADRRLTGAFFLASHSLDLWRCFFWLLLLDLLAMERIFKNLLSGL